MEISLEHVQDSTIPSTFRVAFHSSQERLLLPYPVETGLRFCDAAGEQVGAWGTSYLISSPQDDFVLYPGARIAFDLYANINDEVESKRWKIKIPRGCYRVYYLFHVKRDTDWYDFLRKRSRFVDLTRLWQGTVRSNSIEYELS